MKKVILSAALVAAMLSGCSVMQVPGFGQPAGSSQMSDSDAILNEANRLALKVRNGEINKVEAADELDAFRIKRVGRNPVDDDTFATYRAGTVARESGKLGAQAAQARMRTKLVEWQRGWQSLSNRPRNPAFTNYLMRVFGLPPLVARP
ncbi:hypothetical protein [Crenobacter cavernae]|uniref:Prokaryotic membrane lipolipid attachment site family protein n=1 Tax=Crenobacter cavernae TaxID=2290923 RepID=A0A345Y251_9NEIS|nr:hypothetical protein [Crenobacter cavernae]AXK38003.1 hypothetical protein DWG20_00370 [Crenobacter cavernae]